MKRKWNAMPSYDRYDFLRALGYTDSLALNKFCFRRWEELFPLFRYRIMRMYAKSLEAQQLRSLGAAQ